MNDNTKLKQLTLRISENLHKEFKVNAAKQGQSMGEIAIELIKKYLGKDSDPL
jgi:predicted HicB family RNase H-like nuclease